MFNPANAHLPIPKNGQDFEYFVRRVFAADLGVRVESHGRSGQRQRGVDAYYRPGGGYVGVQCKKLYLPAGASLRLSTMREEVRKALSFKPSIQRLILATTAQRDERSQDEARLITERHARDGLFSVQIVYWDDLCELLHAHPELTKEFYSFFFVEAPGIQAVFRLVKDRLNTEGRIRAPALATDIASGGAGAGFIGSEEAAALLRYAMGESTHKAPAIETDGPTLAVEGISRLQSSAMALRALSLVATAPMPMKIEYLVRIFPNIEWAREIELLERDGLVASEEGRYSATEAVEARLVPNGDSARPYREEWLSALDEHRGTSDVEWFAGYLLLRLGRIREAVETFVAGARICEIPHWCDAYVAVLSPLLKSKYVTHLSRDRRANFYLALGLSFARGDDPQSALRMFDRLYSFSRTSRLAWGVRKALYHKGNVLHSLGEMGAAESALNDALARSIRARDYDEATATTYILAMCCVDRSADEAEALLNQCDRFKEKCKDRRPFTGLYFGRGVIAAYRGEFGTAQRWFRKAIAAADRMNQLNALCLSRLNLARSFWDDGKPFESAEEFERAARDAREYGFVALEAQACEGEGAAREAIENYASAEVAFQRAIQLRLSIDEEAQTLVSIHGVGVIHLRRMEVDAARISFRKALRIARRWSEVTWIAKCSRDIAETFRVVGDECGAEASLVKIARSEERAKRFNSAAECWFYAFRFSFERGKSGKLLRRMYERCIACCDQADDAYDHNLQARLTMHQFASSSGEFEEALGILQSAAELARRARDADMECRIRDQIGVDLQQMGRVQEGLREHRKALRIARRVADAETIEFSLANVGEGLRRLGRFEEAERSLAEAASVATQRGDVRSALEIERNRASCLNSRGEFAVATAILLNCKSAARREKLWLEYSFALAAMGDVARNNNDIRRAAKYYAQSIQHIGDEALGEFGKVYVNYAEVLLEAGKPQEALSLLESKASQLGRAEFAFDFFECLATALEDVERNDDALIAWRSAHDAASLGDDVPNLLEAKLSLGRLTSERRWGSEALRVARSSFAEAEFDEERALARYYELQALIQLDRRTIAAAVLDELNTKYRRACTPQTRSAASHMFAEYLGPMKGRWAEAIQHWIASMSVAASFDVEQSGFLLASLAPRLSFAPELTPDTLLDIEKQTRSWLTKTNGISSTFAMHLTWPIRVAARFKSEKQNLDAVSPDIERRLLMLVEEEGIVPLHKARRPA